ncbi:YcaO-like family protein [Solwaraspora sp. WMMD937]|uniref:YcaO-like family protein n=1 Tax=Solwaraspora sp. WMMD937 TaxID=3016090 RepID=UPI00249A0318|nr:YcaO-like family protein [Solwaraspora sp. WMMD937]WFE22196.1 YcaO-like family protein [Solwaraspora sp. WMMD937]
MPASPEAIAFHAGTYRTATVAQTWQRVEPMCGRFQITRVADITRLDEIGLPVHAAYRPVGRTMAVSVGTGATPEQSRVSAVMESIESWHAENPRLEIVTRSPAGDLDLSYELRSLHLAPRSPLTDRVVLDWVVGHGLVTGTPVLVPLATILLDFTTRRDWNRMLFTPTSNGLASGNTRTEATLHALLELIERDCIAPYTTAPLNQRRYVDPSTATNPLTKRIHQALDQAGCWIEVCDITNRIGVPCYASSIWSPDLPITFGGFGCHVDPQIAVGRAMSEAAQSRLVTVSGARDDIDATAYRPATAAPVHPSTVNRPQAPVPPAPPPPARVSDVVSRLGHQVLAATGIEPFCVDLTHDDIGIPISKVFAPGLLMFDERALSIRPGATDA